MLLTHHDQFHVFQAWGSFQFHWLRRGGTVPTKHNRYGHIANTDSSTLPASACTLAHLIVYHEPLVFLGSGEDRVDGKVPTLVLHTVYHLHIHSYCNKKFSPPWLCVHSGTAQILITDDYAAIHESWVFRDLMSQLRLSGQPHVLKASSFPRASWLERFHCTCCGLCNQKGYYWQ